MNFYEILGVSADATDQQIKEAYRREAMKWHPDRHEGFAAKGNADRRFKDLALAYRTLRDPAARTEYDRQLKFKLNQEFEARQREQARQRQEQERQRQQKQSYREQPKDDFADTQRPPDEEETMSGADADQMFREQMLDLATELAARGFPEFNIYKALVALGCPENMAKVVAAIAAKRGDTADVGKNGATKSNYQNSTSPPESDNTLRSKAIAKSWEDSERLFIAALVGPGFECPSNTQFTMIKAVRAALFFAMTAVIFGLFTQGESLDMDSMIGIFILSPLIGWGLMFGLLELSPSHRQYVLTHRINTYLPILKDLYLGTKKHRSSASIFFPAPWFGYYGIVWPLVGVAALFFTIDFLLLVYVGSDVHKQTSLLSIYKFAQNPLAYSLFWIGLGTMFNQLLFANIKSGIEKFNVKGSSTVEQKLYEKCRPRLWRAYLVTALFFLIIQAPAQFIFPLAKESIDNAIASEKMSAVQLYDQGKIPFTNETNNSNLSSTSALQYLRIAADKGHIPAEALLGYIYFYGKTIPKDEGLAAFWIKRAALHNDAWSVDMLGNIAYHGLLGFNKNEHEAVSYWQTAAKLGSASAQVSLGWSYMIGSGGLPVNFSQAVYWNDLGARGGHPEGYNNLGWLYETGQGVVRDIPTAAILYQKAADMGNEEAKQRILKLASR